MRDEHIKQGNRANPKGFKQLGYKRLSSTTWVRDRMKVQVIRGRIANITGQVSFKQPIFTFRSKNAKHNQTAREVVKLLRIPSPFREY